MTDRRRINGPIIKSLPPLYDSVFSETSPYRRHVRTREATRPRKILLKTGLTASACGSAYYELEPSLSQRPGVAPSSLKISCTVHGPKPLPRNLPFSPQLLLTTHVKFSPYASRQRRGFSRDSTERDLGAHLETALRGVILGDRWPKSGVEVVVTILEGEDDGPTLSVLDPSIDGDTVSGWGDLNVLAGCITAASAALVEAGIDCIDLVSGGCAALVSIPNNENAKLVVDPNFAEHSHVSAACVVGYLGSRDELVELWIKGEGTERTGTDLVDQAVHAARSSRTVLSEVLKENLENTVVHKTRTNAQKLNANVG